MKTWTELTWEEIHNLPMEEFDKLAKLQSTIFPELLKVTDEEEIIYTFYQAFERNQI